MLTRSLEDPDVGGCVAASITRVQPPTGLKVATRKAASGRSFLGSPRKRAS